MTYTPTIYDWRDSCAPLDQMFRAGGEAMVGGLTLGGTSVENPEPGGRAELHLQFAAFTSEQANRDASWLISRILNRNVMRVRLWETVQLVPAADLSPPVTEGVPWGNDQPWANDENWFWNPWVPVNAAAAKGAASFTANLNGLGEVLQIGHVVGFFADGYDFAHVVMDIEYDASDVATVQVSPPLRRALTTDDAMLFRPSMLVTCRNAREVAGQFMRGRHTQLNAAQLVEALV